MAVVELILQHKLLKQKRLVAAAAEEEVATPWEKEGGRVTPDLERKVMALLLGVNNTEQSKWAEASTDAEQAAFIFAAFRVGTWNNNLNLCFPVCYIN